MQRRFRTIEFAASGGDGDGGVKNQLSRSPRKMGDGGYNPRVLTQGSIEFTACEELVVVGSAS